MGHRIEVATKEVFNQKNESLVSVRPVKVYQINDSLKTKELDKISHILADPIAEKASVDSPVLTELPPNTVLIEQSPKPGVTDPHGDEVRKVLSRTLQKEIGQVSFSQQYVWAGDINNETQFKLVTKQLGNPLINSFRKINAKDWNQQRGMKFNFPVVDLATPKAFEYIDLEVSDQELQRISKERYIGLGLDAMKSIKTLFKSENFLEQRKKAGLEEKATDAEIEGLGSSWSDHCNHNKFRARWEYTTDEKNDEAHLPPVIDNLLKTLIIDPSRDLIKELGYGVSVFEDNSGVIKLNEKWNIAHKVETHNHPSGEDGFGGANTGTGGVLRDPFHTGIGMKPVSSQFSFRTAHPNAYQDLPLDTQSPSRTLETIIEGVEDYGNKIGVPTKSGAVMIDEGWFKPGVYVGAIAVQRAEINKKLTHIKNIQPGYLAISLGGKIGKDGVHGASGSSIVIDSTNSNNEQVTQSVQIGSPITQKEYFDVALILEEQGLIEASQDCGAGGWHSAVGELAALCNAFEYDRKVLQEAFSTQGINASSPLEEKLKVAKRIVDINTPASPSVDLIKLEIESNKIFERASNGKAGVLMDLTSAKEKYSGLMGWEKLVSESQERGIIVIKPDNLERVLSICSHYDVEATPIAQFNETGFYHVKDQNQSIVFLPINFIHKGIPQMTIKSNWKKPSFEEPLLPQEDSDFTQVALELLAKPNLQSYNWIFERFDTEVRGGSLIKPIVGRGRGKSDAIADNPVLTEKEVTVETYGSNPWQGDIDSYHMGRNNVVDAIGRVIAVGGNLERITFNGNTTCPPPEKDEYDAAKVIRMIKGATDAQKVFKSPTISGKDSTSMMKSYKSTVSQTEKIVKAKPELLMSALAILPDDSTLITPDFKLPGDRIFIVGETKDECGASEYYLYHKAVGNNIPKSDLPSIRKRYESLSKATQEGLLHSAQYLAKGGLWCALSNSALSGDLGTCLEIESMGEYRPDTLLFSETTGRLLVSVHPTRVDKFREAMKDEYVAEIGTITENKSVRITYKERPVITTNIEEMRKINEGGIKF